MEESIFQSCALLIERSFYTQSKHERNTCSYALIVLRLVASTGQCLSRVINKPFLFYLIPSQGGDNMTPSWEIKLSDYSISSFVT